MNNIDFSEQAQAVRTVPVRDQPDVVPISLEDQEVLCSNCYETIPMLQVDTHSVTCFKEQKGMTPRVTVHSEDEDAEYNTKLQELDERIVKLINTFLKKLES